MLYRHQLLQWEDSLRDLRRQQRHGATTATSDGGPQSKDKDKDKGHDQSTQEPSSSSSSSSSDGPINISSTAVARGMFSEVTVAGTRSLQDVERERRKNASSQSRSRARDSREDDTAEKEKAHTKKRQKIRK